MAQDPEWLSRKQAASYLIKNGCPITPKRLGKMAMHGNAGSGPPFYRSGWRTVTYLREELDEWRKKRMVRVE